MEVKKGDYVTRNSYQNDTIFKVINPPWFAMLVFSLKVIFVI